MISTDSRKTTDMYARKKGREEKERREPSSRDPLRDKVQNSPASRSDEKNSDLQFPCVLNNDQCRNAVRSATASRKRFPRVPGQ